MNRMSQDEWIASRTNNPDRLGKDVWKNAYNEFRKEDLQGTIPQVSLETQKELLRDFLEKNGCEGEGADNNIVRDGMNYIVRNIDKDFEKMNITPKQMQSLYSQLKNLTHSVATNSKSPSKSVPSNMGRD